MNEGMLACCVCLCSNIEANHSDAISVLRSPIPPDCTLTRTAADAFGKAVIETGCSGHSDINFSEGRACCWAPDKM